jgi:hypothetical protein
MVEHGVGKATAQPPSLAVGTDAHSTQVPQPRHDLAGTVVGPAQKTQGRADQLTEFVGHEQDRARVLLPRPEPVRVGRETPSRVRKLPHLDRRAHLADVCRSNKCHLATISKGGVRSSTSSRTGLGPTSSGELARLR